MKGLRPISLNLRCVLYFPLTKLTWFMKGLRRWVSESLSATNLAAGTKLTWFMKGLRLWPAVGYESPDIDQIDLIYEGITTLFFEPCYLVCGLGTKLTWFMKGLRLCSLSRRRVFPLSGDQIDLIYEGITTVSSRPICFRVSGPNWPDLWRDYDQGADDVAFALVVATKLTWFMKGLRHDAHLVALSFFLWSLTKLTWFMKGLRLWWVCHPLFSAIFMTKLTWFMKGLRLWLMVGPLCVGGCCRPNWPDLWRDYDHAPSSFALSASSIKDQIDLIYEGITTPLNRISVFIQQRNWPNWPDLWRDYDRPVGVLYISECKFYDQIDLIYEGITTEKMILPTVNLPGGPNWPDLWRDYDR